MHASTNLSSLLVSLVSLVALPLTMSACIDVEGMDPANPQRGPGELVGNGDPITDGNFPGGYDQPPAPRDLGEGVEPPTSGPIECNAACQQYCEDLDLTNPVNRGVCTSLWGAGLASQPVDRRQACRKL